MLELGYRYFLPEPHLSTKLPFCWYQIILHDDTGTRVLSYEIRMARIILASRQLHVWTVLLGARSWGWVWLEADPRWCIPSGHSSPAVHGAHRHWLSHLTRIILHDRLRHCRRALHRVSSLYSHLYNWGTCIAPPTRRPRAHHRVSPYPGARRQNETEMFSDYDETSSSIAAVSALLVACSMLAVQQQKRLCCQFVDMSAIRWGCHTMKSSVHYLVIVCPDRDIADTQHFTLLPLFISVVQSATICLLHRMFLGLLLVKASILKSETGEFPCDFEDVWLFTVYKAEHSWVIVIKGFPLSWKVREFHWKLGKILNEGTTLDFLHVLSCLKNSPGIWLLAIGKMHTYGMLNQQSRYLFEQNIAYLRFCVYSALIAVPLMVSYRHLYPRELPWAAAGSVHDFINPIKVFSAV